MENEIKVETGDKSTVATIGLSANEKRAQINEAVGPAVKVDTEKILYPEPIIFEVGGRKYPILPLSLSKMKYLARLVKLSNVSQVTDELLDEVAETTGKLLGETDKDFLLDNFTVPKIAEFYRILEEVNFLGVPKAKGAQGKN